MPATCIIESARLAWLESARARDQRDGQGSVVVRAGCHYRQPIPYPETVQVNLYASVPGRSSFTTYDDSFSAGDDSIKYADGRAMMVWADRASGKPLPIPDHVHGVVAAGGKSSSPM